MALNNRQILKYMVSLNGGVYIYGEFESIAIPKTALVKGNHYQRCYISSS